jgi:hypothetical protein
VPAADFEDLAGVFENEEIEDGAFVERRVKVGRTALLMVEEIDTFLSKRNYLIKNKSPRSKIGAWSKLFSV